MVDAQTPTSHSPADGQATSLLNGDTDDWPARATATVVDYVGTVRDKTTGPALLASRDVVYFAAIGLIAAVAGVISLVLVIRLLVVASGYLPFVESGESWFAYLVLGFVFALIGLIMWRKKEPRRPVR
jgi:uncharacterized membrane protein